MRCTESTPVTAGKEQLRSGQPSIDAADEATRTNDFRETNDTSEKENQHFAAGSRVEKAIEPERAHAKARGRGRW
ncbi:hypothetical protein [Desulfobulbus sp.]|uniref:hypothetical protein n=1 Tax=Desulfobulbus sp. TaxID=895 RepID=UPI00286F1AA8|nr:hypothetical protein [Desulfobulbus sp.]